VTPSVRRGGERFVTRREGLELRHSFSFGEHYDPDNISFGLLLAANEMLLAPGAGFEMHEHRDTEIVSWVLSGSLEHRDSRGHVAVIGPAMAQRLSAGRGVLHSEKTSGPEPAHVVQMWIAPDEPGIEPSYEERDFSANLESGALVPVASGDARHGAALSIHQPKATLYVTRLGDGVAVQLPVAPHLHVFVARGSVTVKGIARLDTGDAVRIADAPQLTAAATSDAEILVWAMGISRHARQKPT
jgi:redox-sensitive bicupin YhaK (pirin superfamily)